MKKKPDDIKQIEVRIANLQKKEQQVRKNSSGESEFVFATKTGFRVGTELLSGVVVGAGLGYVLTLILSWGTSCTWQLGSSGEEQG